MVKIHFAAFWASFDREVNFFRDGLLEGVDTVVTQDNPDIVFFSCFGDPQCAGLLLFENSFVKVI
jgi:hypothetical protein